MGERKSRIVSVRISASLKEDIMLILIYQGDTLSGFLTRCISRYVRDHAETLARLRKEQKG